MEGRIARTAAVAAPAAALAGLAVLFAFSSGAVRFEARLVARDGAGRKVAEIALPDGKFDHVFVHSFHLTPVEERFRVERSGLFGARLRLYELRYESLGTGMPDATEGDYRLEDGKFVLGMERTFDRVPILVSIVPGHGIAAGGRFHPFTDWVPPRGRVQLEGRFALAIFPRRPTNG